MVILPSDIQIEIFKFLSSKELGDLALSHRIPKTLQSSIHEALHVAYKSSHKRVAYLLWKHECNNPEFHKFDMPHIESHLENEVTDGKLNGDQMYSILNEYNNHDDDEEEDDDDDELTCTLPKYAIYKLLFNQEDDSKTPDQISLLKSNNDQTSFPNWCLCEDCTLHLSLVISFDDNTNRNTGISPVINNQSDPLVHNEANIDVYEVFHGTDIITMSPHERFPIYTIHGKSFFRNDSSPSTTSNTHIQFPLYPTQSIMNLSLNYINTFEDGSIAYVQFHNIVTNYHDWLHLLNEEEVNLDAYLTTVMFHDKPLQLQEYEEVNSELMDEINRLFDNWYGENKSIFRNSFNHASWIHVSLDCNLLKQLQESLIWLLDQRRDFEIQLHKRLDNDYDPFYYKNRRKCITRTLDQLFPTILYIVSNNNSKTLPLSSEQQKAIQKCFSDCWIMYTIEVEELLLVELHRTKMKDIETRKRKFVDDGAGFFEIKKCRFDTSFEFCVKNNSVMTLDKG